MFTSFPFISSLHSFILVFVLLIATLSLSLVCDAVLECKRVCLSSTQVSVCFPFCSLNLGPQSSLSPRTHSILPRTSRPRPHTCGPGGAGACSPEDRGSAGSQKHLSVPFPLCPRAPGTALNSAPGASECVFKERRRESTPALPE